MIDTFSKLKLEDIVTGNEAMAKCLRLARFAAKSEVPALLLGESGTGKTLMARAIHNSCGRSTGPFISFNASAMSDTLLESQLFGHERGAFTGAHAAVKGKFELAHRGTLFLDEIADMSPLAQVKILRVLEYGEFERLGSERISRVDVRVMAASNCSLQERIRQGKFREDLYHRLGSLTLLIPPLRKRAEELPSLISTELKAQARAADRHITGIHPEAMAQLLDHPWRGNLRELSHVVGVMILLCDSEVIMPEHVIFSADLPPSPAVPKTPFDDPAAPAGRADDLSLTDAIHRHVRHVYDLCGRNQRRTAKKLGISRSRLDRYLAALGKERP
jgi:transcriptional regulator with PAS, ATPase and Fis domain